MAITCVICLLAVILSLNLHIRATSVAAKEGSPGVSKTKLQQPDPRLRVILDDINRKKREVESYDRAAPNTAFEIGTPYWVLFAVSKPAREGYFRGLKANDAYRSALNKTFDYLAEAV